MKYARWIALLTLVAILAGCSQTPTPAPQDTGTTIPRSVTASGVIVPAQEAQMSFTISGQVKSVNVEAGERVKAGQMLMALNSAGLDAAVAEAEAELRGKQALWEYLLLPRSDNIVLWVENREIARTHVVQAEAALATARAIQAQATLVAPFDATVVSVDISRGEIADTGQVVIALGDLKQLQVETTDLNEQDIPRVQPGHPATAYVAALNVEISGQVIRITPKASIVGGDTVYTVTIQLDEQPQGLLWGMSVEVEIS